MRRKFFGKENQVKFELIYIDFANANEKVEVILVFVAITLEVSLLREFIFDYIDLATRLV